MNTTLSVLVCGGLLFTASGGDGSKSLPVANNNEFRILSIATLASPFVKDPVPPLGLAIARQRNDDFVGEVWDGGYPEGAELFKLPSRAPIAIDRVIDEVRTVDPEAWETEGASLQSGGKRLFMSSKAAVLDRARAHVARLRAGVTPKVRLRYVCFEDAQGGMPAYRLLSGAEATSMVERAAAGALGKVLHHGTSECRAGDRVTMAEHRRTWLQHDVDVEVATESKIGDPVVPAIPTGRGLTCMPIAMDGGKIALFGFFTSRAIDGGVRKQDLVSPGLTHVELAEVAQSQNAFSVALPATGGVMMAPGGAEDAGLRVVVSCERLESPAANDSSAIIPTGIVSSLAFRKFMLGSSKSGRGVQVDPDLDADMLVSFAAQLSGAGDKEGFSCEAGAMHMSIRGTAQDVGAAVKAARFAMKHMTRSFLVQVALEAKSADGGGWKRIGQPLSVSCLGNRVGYALSGHEHSYVADYNVEIAQEAAIADPVVTSVFAGTQLVTAVEPAGDECRVQVFLLSRGVLDMRRVSPGAESVGAIWCPEESEVKLRRALTLKPGTTVSLGEGPARNFEDEQHRTRLVLTLTEL